MNGKIRIPLTGDPTSYPPAGAVYVWVDENKELKSMGSDGSILDLCSQNLSGLTDIDLDTVSDGQVLAYDLASNKWVGRQIFDPQDLNDSVTVLENSVAVLQSTVDNLPTGGGDTSEIESNVADNAVAIASNATNIASTVEAVVANTTALDGHEGQLNQLETDIDNAEQDILSNTSILDTHTLSIGNLESSVSGNSSSLSSNTDAISSNSDDIDLHSSRLDTVEGDISTLENEIDNLGGGGNPLEDENGVVQAEAIDGFLKVNNRLSFTGASIRIGEGTGETDNDAGTGGEIAIGTKACWGAAAKTNGIGIGVQALYNVSGSANIGIGLNAGNGNSGNYNVNVGNSAGQYRIISSSNVNIGYASGYNGRGNDNIYLGAWCGAVAASNSIIENKMLRIGTKGGAAAEFLDKELIIGNMDPDVDGGQWLLVNGNLRLKSPNGSQWTIKVDDSGILSTEAVS